VLADPISRKKSTLSNGVFCSTERERKKKDEVSAEKKNYRKQDPFH